MPHLRTKRRCDFQFLVASFSPDYAVGVSESTAFSIAERRQLVQRQTAKPVAERRNARRFVLEIPVLFRWTDDSQATHEGAGFCRDISTEGVLMIAFGALPPLGRPLELMVLLPPLDPKAPTMRLCATGSVVRMEAVGKATGLGIATVFGDRDHSDHRASSFPEEKVSLPCS